MRDFDFVDLRLFASVCRTGSIARTADLEHLAPSAVSKRLTYLEGRAGTALLHRDRNNMRPTAFGKIILDEAELIFSAAHRITRSIEQSKSFPSGLIRVLTCSSSISWRLVDRVSELLGDLAFSKVQVEIYESSSSEIVKRLLDSSADIGICRDDVDLSCLRTHFLGTDVLGVIVPARHRLVARSACILDDIAEEAHVALTGSSASRGLVNRVADSRGLRVNYRLLVPTIDTALKAVQAGMGIAVLPTELVQPYAAHFNLTIIPLAEPWAERRYHVCSKHDVDGTAAELLALLGRAV